VHLSIDSEKVKEALLHTEEPYAVFVHHIDLGSMAFELPSASVYGTTTEVPYDVQRAKKRFLSLRKKITESGTILLKPEELEREIDEIKGRHSR
jgi:hypothetical protein